MKKVLITGALGHIGSHLLREYQLDKDYEIVVLDSLVTQRYSTLFDLPNKISFYEGDIREDHMLVKWKEIFDGVDTVIHMAGTVNAGETLDKEGETRDVNYNGTVNMLNLCSRYNIRKFVLLSSASVYGPVEGVGVRSEDTRHFNPQSPYATSKLNAEHAVLASNIPYKYVLRFGTIFGYSRGMRFHTVTNKFLWQAVNGEYITIWEPGTGKRPYLSLADSSEILTNLMKSDYPSGVYNAATAHWSPLEIVEVLEEYIPAVKIMEVRPPILNQQSFIIDSSKAKKAGLLTVEDPESKASLYNYIGHMVHTVMRNMLDASDSSQYSL